MQETNETYYDSESTNNTERGTEEPKEKVIRIGNCRLSNTIIDKILFDKTITSIEIDILLWLSLKQDEFGKIEGVRYAEVCEDIRISNQTYYDCIARLEFGQYITVSECNRFGWDIIINDNIFLGEEDYKKGYLTTNRAIIHNPIFYKLKANEKKLVLKILTTKKDFLGKGGSDSQDFFLYVTTIKNWLGITNKYLIDSYMKSLANIFEIYRFKKGEKGEKIGYVIKNTNPIQRYISRWPSAEDFKKTEKEQFLSHKFKAMCRRKHIKYTLQDIKDLITLTTQYAKKIGLCSFYYIITRVLEAKKSIECKLINAIISNKIKEQRELETTLQKYLNGTTFEKDPLIGECGETYKNSRGFLKEIYDLKFR